MYLKESFYDALWVSLSIQRTLYLKHDFACKVYVLSSRVTHVKACNVYVLCKRFARLFWRRTRLCSLSGYAPSRFRLFQRRPLLSEKYKPLVRPLHPVGNGAVCPGVRTRPRLGGGTSHYLSFKSIESYVISNTSDTTLACNFR
jgi:hypothetical protein